MELSSLLERGGVKFRCVGFQLLLASLGEIVHDGLANSLAFVFRRTVDSGLPCKFTKESTTGNKELQGNHSFFSLPLFTLI